MTDAPEQPKQTAPTLVGTVTPQAQQMSLEDLLKLAGPIVEDYFEEKGKEQERELAFETKVLEHESARFRVGVVAGSLLGGFVLFLAGFLINRGDVPSARDLIALVVTATGAWFGGYGMARRRDSSTGGEE